MSRAWARLRGRPFLAAALVYAALALVFVSPGLVPGRVMSHSDSLYFQPPWNSNIPRGLERPANPEVGDAPSQMYPFVKYSKERLPDIPLWNPYISAGRPFLGNMQSQVFSPFSVPAYVMPFYKSLAVTAALKLFIAAFGTFLLARGLRMRFGGALLAGVVYAYSLWVVTWLVYPHASVWVLIPLLMWLADRLLRRPSAPNAVGLAAGVGVQFLAGHPESSFHALFALTAFVVLRLAVLRRAGGLPSLGRPAGMYVAGVVGGALLAALVLLPFAELLLHSADIHQRSGVAAHNHLAPRFVLGLFLPDYWGKPTGTSIEFFLLARACYAGALPLMLGLVALVFRPTLQRVAVAVFGAGCLAVAFGVPPLFQIVSHLPVFSGGHNTRLIALAMLCTALLAGWGLDELTERLPKGRRARLALGGAALIFLVPVVSVLAGGKTSLDVLGRAFDVAWRFATPPPEANRDAGDTIRLAALLGWLVVAGAGVALLAMRSRFRLSAPAFAALAVVLTAADLFRVGMGYNPAIDADIAAEPATGAIRHLEAHRDSRFVAMGGTVPENVIPMDFHLYEPRAYDLPIERRYDRFWRRKLSPEFPSQVGADPSFIPLTLPKVTAARLRVLDILGVGQIFQPRDQRPPRGPGLRVSYTGPDGRVWANDGALPRVWIAGRQQVARGEDAQLRLVGAPGLDARSTAVTGRRVPGVPELAGGPAGRARITRYEPERVSISAGARRPGMLVLSDLDYPGWKAKVDGRDVPVERVDYAFRGVPLAAGSHRVEFRYEPLSWRLGWILSVLAVIGAAGALGASWRAGAGGRRP
jgi:membrane protein YfhO